MLLYHGSNIIIKEPMLIKQNRGLDFGDGFYLTTNEEQAVRFSEIVFKRRKTGFAAVSIYDFNMNTAEENLDIQKFLYADAVWHRFITENRLKTYSGKNYDMVIGPVANDTVMPTIQLYLNGFLNEEATIITLKTYKLADQICLKTDKALSMLSFTDSYSINDRKHKYG